MITFRKIAKPTEVLTRLIDKERIFTYRALRYTGIFDEFQAVRRLTILLLQNLPDKVLTRKGGILDSNGHVIYERTARSLAYHIAGHELRHIKIIKE